MRKTRAVGVDIGSASVKVVVLRRRAGKLELTGASVVDLPAGDEDLEARARGVRDALAAAGARGAEAALAIPQHQALLRLVRLPGAPSEQMARAAILEGTRDLPFPTDSVAAGVLQGPSEEPEETLALVASAQKGTIDAYRKMVAAAGGHVGNLGVSSLAMAAAADPGDASWLLMDVGASATTLCLCSGGLARTSRTVLVGGEHLTQAIAADVGCDEKAAEDLKRSRGLGAAAQGGAGGEVPGATGEWLGQITAEVKLLLTAAAAQGQTPPAVIRLAGGGSQTMGLAASLERAIGLPVELLRVAVLSNARPEDTGRLAAACGMALVAMGEVRTPDLLAEETQRAEVSRRRRQRAWVGAAVALLVLSGGGVSAHRSWCAHQDAAKERAAAARAATAERGLLKTLEAKQQSLSAQAEVLRGALRPKPAWIEVVDALAAAAPSGVWVTGIELERGKPLNVRGTALEASDAARFVKALMASPLFERVQLSFANGALLAGRRVTHFGVSAVVKGNLPEKRVQTTTSRRRTTSTAKGAEE